jgi:TolB-like protein
MSGDRDQEFFADGITEDIITALARYPSLFVIACNSCFTYKGRAVAPSEGSIAGNSRLTCRPAVQHQLRR